MNSSLPSAPGASFLRAASEPPTRLNHRCGSPGGCAGDQGHDPEPGAPGRCQCQPGPSIPSQHSGRQRPKGQRRPGVPAARGRSCPCCTDATLESTEPTAPTWSLLGRAGRVPIPALTPSGHRTAGVRPEGTPGVQPRCHAAVTKARSGRQKAGQGPGRGDSHVLCGQPLHSPAPARG